MRRTIFLLLVMLLVVVACRSPRPPAEQLTPLPFRPLAGLAGQNVVVLPAHYLRPADSLGWSAQIKQPREYLAALDREIEFALGERGFRTQWVFPEQLARSAKRNAVFAQDPYALAGERLRPGARAPQPDLHEPLASQVRRLVALHNARYALFPVELRFERHGGTGTVGRAVLRAALLDARLSRVRWVGDVAGDTASAFSPALAASVAERLADMIAAP